MKEEEYKSIYEKIRVLKNSKKEDEKNLALRCELILSDEGLIIPYDQKMEKISEMIFGKVAGKKDDSKSERE